MTTYHSQVQQDLLLDTAVFCGLRNGVFVDIGAYDGVALSNTLMFERDRGWSGLCIEANPEVFPKLQAARKAKCLNVAVAATSGYVTFTQITGYAAMLSGITDKSSVEHSERIKREVTTNGGVVRKVQVRAMTPAAIFAENGIDEIHYLSVDTEGNEPDILRAIDYDKTMVHIIDTECNFTEDLPALIDALGDRFSLVRKFRHDAFFVNKRSPYMNRIKALRAGMFRYNVKRRAKKFARLIGINV